ncbi:MAG: GNAT family N-acetyltransferase [Saprospiraceae bacterium]
MPLEKINTSRLYLRPFQITDAEALFQLDSDPEVLRYLHEKPKESVDEVKERILAVQLDYKKYGVGRLAIIHKETGAFIGWSGLKFITESINEHSDFYDVGYRLLKEHWGKGYATEAALASVQYGFEKLNLKTIYAMADIKNAGSNNILTKIGMTKVTQFEEDGIPHFFYKIENLKS